MYCFSTENVTKDWKNHTGTKVLQINIFKLSIPTGTMHRSFI